MTFSMVCPKCGSKSFNISRDRRAYSQSDPASDLVFACRCGKQLFGKQVDDEYERQKNAFESTALSRAAEDAEREARLREQRDQAEALRKAMEYRAQYIQDKRRQQEHEEAARREAEDKRWRERVAEVWGPGRMPPALSQPLRPAPVSGALAPLPSRTSETMVMERMAPAPAAPSGLTRAPSKGASPSSAPSGASHAGALQVARTAPGGRNGTVVPVSLQEAGAPLAHRAEARHAPVLKPAPVVIDEADEEEDEEGVTNEAGEGTCDWPGCGKARRKNSKYCSRTCSNKNARARHKHRKHTDRGAPA